MNWSPPSLVFPAVRRDSPAAITFPSRILVRLVSDIVALPETLEVLEWEDRRREEDNSVACAPVKFVRLRAEGSPAPDVAAAEFKRLGATVEDPLIAGTRADDSPPTEARAVDPPIAGTRPEDSPPTEARAVERARLSGATTAFAGTAEVEELPGSA